MKTHLEAIVAAFPRTKVAPDEILGIPPESFDYQRHMGGKDWASVPDQIYERNTDAFILMSPETLKFFIAGYLRVACSTTNSLSAESLIYAATNGDHLGKLCEVLTSEQVACVFDAAEFVYLQNCGDDDDKEFELIRQRRSEMLLPKENRG